MLDALGTYYAQNYAGIINLGLLKSHPRPLQLGKSCVPVQYDDQKS